ncbi:MAG: type II toxin-antitoxin system Phd/YefM family antitoxin [Clostridia bacterium]|jgi:PHD/YefM family antitoxin component YafN of YafNO toxin-antitoxin module|nr:type II toxin-antitoxin system Phd/YefM family antitoxin [Clostridia bacterium]
MPAPIVKPIKDLRDTDTIKQFCDEGRSVIITRNGKTNFVIIGESQYEEYETLKEQKRDYDLAQARLELYQLLAEAESEEAEGKKGRLLKDVHKNLLADLN